MSSLYVCQGCRRHVFEVEESCPFCGATRARGPRLAVQAGVVAAVLVAGMTSLAACPDPQAEEKKLDPNKETTQSKTATTATTKPVDTMTGGDMPKPAYGVPPQLLTPDAAPTAADAGAVDASGDAAPDASLDAAKDVGAKPVPTPTTPKPIPVPAYGVPFKVGPDGNPL